MIDNTDPSTRPRTLKVMIPRGLDEIAEDTIDGVTEFEVRDSHLIAWQKGQGGEYAMQIAAYAPGQWLSARLNEQRPDR